MRKAWACWAVMALVGALASWYGVDVLRRQSAAALLPSLPDPALLPEPVRVHLREADAAARDAPASADAVGALGRAYHASQDDARADQAYAQAEALNPDDWRWTYARALLAESRNRDDTIALLKRVIEREPGLGLAWFRLAEAELKAGRLDAAGPAYERARDAAPWTGAADGDGRTSRTPPLAAYATTGLARVAVERGEMATAEAMLQPLVTQRPPFGPAVRLGRQMRATVDPGRPYVPPADPVLDAIVNESRHVDLLLKHAGIAARAGDAARREFLVRRALTYYPEDPNVLMEMATLLQAAGDHAEALAFLRRHERIEPGDHHGLVEQGRSLIELGRFSEAEQVLRRAIRVRDAAAHYNLGMALDRQGRWDDARDQYQRALAIDPFHARAMNNLAVGFARLGDRRAARALHERAVAAAPDNPEVHANMAIALMLDGQFAEAIASLERALALDPDSADAHNNMGVALGQMGRLDQAAVQFREALRLNPSHADAKRNLARLSPTP